MFKQERNKQGGNKVAKFREVSERIAYTRIQMKPLNLSITNVYAPTEKVEEKAKDEWQDEVEKIYEKIFKQDVIMILGDLNIQIARKWYKWRNKKTFLPQKKKHYETVKVCSNNRDNYSQHTNQT